MRARLAEEGWSWPTTEVEEEEGAEERGPPAPNAHLTQTALDVVPQDAADASLDAAALKTQRTLMLIVREMLQTERDYVRALEYVIEVSSVGDVGKLY